MKSLYLGFLAFAAYTSIYGFRKPWAISPYDTASNGVISDAKAAFSMAQTVGYGIGKFAAIPFVGAIPTDMVPQCLVTVGLFSTLCWFFFGLVGTPYKLVVIALGAIPLAATWSLVFRLIEGRENTELISTLLGCSLVVASGFSKMIGGFVSNFVGESWIPFVTALIFLPCFVRIVQALTVFPSRTSEEFDRWGKRQATSFSLQMSFVSQHLVLVGALCLASMAVTAFRDIRDTFQADIWQTSPTSSTSSIVFLFTEIPAMLVTFILLNSLRKSARPSLSAPDVQSIFSQLSQLCLVMFAGFALIWVASSLSTEWISVTSWYLLTGIGTYLVYVPLNTVVCDRLTSFFGFHGSSVVLIQIAEAAGYLASVFVFFRKSEIAGRMTMQYLNRTAYLLSGVGLVGVSLTLGYMAASRYSLPYRRPLMTLLVIISMLFTGRTLISSSHDALRIFVDVDNVLADAQPRFYRHALPSWPGTHFHEDAFRSSVYGADVPMTGAKEALTLLRDRGASITILTARSSYEDAFETTTEWLRQNGIPFDQLMVTSSSSEKQRAFRNCDVQSCVFIDDLTRGHESKFHSFHTQLLCNASLPVRLELFDPFYNNWKNIIRALDNTSPSDLPSVLQENVRVVRSRCIEDWSRNVMTDRFAHLQMTLSDEEEYDLAWIISQCKYMGMDCLEEARVNMLLLDSLHVKSADGWYLPKQHQRMNALRGITYFMSSKTNLCHLLQRNNLAGIEPFGGCFVLPLQWDDLLNMLQADPSKLWIYKPATNANGVGVRIFHSHEVPLQVDSNASAIIQHYVHNPILYKGFKVDIRFYAVVMSFDPFRVYVYKKAYARVGGAAYNMTDLSPVAHVTNSMENKQYIRLTYEQVEELMSKEYNIDVEKVRSKIHRMAWQSVGSMALELGCTSKSSAQGCGAFFQHFCIDFIIDQDGGVWLLEFNADPSTKYRNDAIWKDDIARADDILRMVGAKKSPHAWAEQAKKVREGICEAQKQVADVPVELARMMMEYQWRGQFHLAFPPVREDEWSAIKDSDLVHALFDKDPHYASMYSFFRSWAQTQP
eukprot:GILJ01002303.1.p1 GENE.GILJ01002303.1~~GILJ01002303.1.p1  ORF type:complete len:1058 (-),score=108.14 GILJ01002303.1:160-3333(-)